MSFNDFCSILQLDFDGVIISSAVRKRNIWILRDNFELLIFQRNDLSKVEHYPFNPILSQQPKLYVDDEGEKCILLFLKGAPLYFTISNPVFRSIDVPKNVLSSCGCWVKREKALPAFLIGTMKGEIILIVPGSNQKACYIYKTTQNSKILEMASVFSENTTFIYIYVDNHIYSFSGTDQIEFIFMKGPSPHIVFAGQPTEIGANRIVPQTQSNTIGVIIDYGALLLTPIQSGASTNFKQDLYEFKTDTVTTFALSKFGMLFADSTGIPVVYNGAKRVTVPLPDVMYILVDDGEYFFITTGDIIKFTEKEFTFYLCRTAIDVEDIKYASFVLKMDESVLNNVLTSLKKKKAEKFVQQLSIPVEQALVQFTDDSLKLLFFKCLLNRINKKWKRQRYAIACYVLQLFCDKLPEGVDEFKEFLTNNHQLYKKELLYRKLEETGWKEGVFFVANLFNDTEKITDLHILYSETDDALAALAKKYNPALIRETLYRIKDKEKVEKFILDSKILNSHEVMTLLSIYPKTASYIIGEYPSNNIARSLLIISLCMSKDALGIKRLISTGLCDLYFVIRISEYFKLYTATANAFIKLQKPKEAIEAAMKSGFNDAHSCIFEMPTDEMKKEGYKALLNLCSDNQEQKDQILNEMSSSSIFSFEDMMDYIEDDDLLFNFGSKIKECVTKMRVPLDGGTYQRNFRLGSKEEFVIKLQDTCTHCEKTLLGKKVVRFPCGHMFHLDCLKDSYRLQDIECGDKEIDFYLQSCPLCGFTSVTRCQKKFPLM